LIIFFHFFFFLFSRKQGLAALTAVRLNKDRLYFNWGILVAFKGALEKNITDMFLEKNDIC